MVSTTELELANKFLKAIKAYKLNCTEAGGKFALKRNLGSPNIAAIDDNADEFRALGLDLEIGSKEVIDPERKEAVAKIMKLFIDDFLKACSINPASPKISISSNEHDRFMLRYEDVAVNGMCDGERPSVADVLNGLDKMIIQKRLGHSL